MRLGLLIVLAHCFSHAVWAAGEVPSAERLPFSSEETTGSLEVVIRHRVSWNAKQRELHWDRAELEISEMVRLVAEPGVFRPGAEKPVEIGLQLHVRDGSLSTALSIRPDGTWSAPIESKLGPRDLQWKEPHVDVRQIALSGRLGIDTRLTSAPLRSLSELTLAPLTATSVKAGIYEAAEVTLVGSWQRPRWTLDSFQAKAFGGSLKAFGSGEWGTPDRPIVSLDLQVDGVDLQAMLKAFNVSRAEQIQARVRGRVHLEAEGRKWSVLDLDLVGEEGTVMLSRQLLYDILSPSLAEVLTRKQIDDALNSAFGRRDMIPFDELSFEGGLTPTTLNLRLPLQNEVLDLDIEPQIDRELLWDIWDELSQIGAENLRGLGSGAAPNIPTSSNTR